MLSLRNLNGWQRLWLVVTGAAFIYALGWGFVRGSSGGGEEVREEVIAAFADSRCGPIVKMPAQSKLSPEPEGESPCWKLYLYRSIYENASTTAKGYVQDIETRRRDWMLGALGIALVIWLVGVAFLYVVGFVVAWVRRGFVRSRQEH